MGNFYLMSARSHWSRSRICATWDEWLLMWKRETYSRKMVSMVGSSKSRLSRHTGPDYLIWTGPKAGVKLYHIVDATLLFSPIFLLHQQCLTVWIQPNGYYLNTLDKLRIIQLCLLSLNFSFVYQNNLRGSSSQQTRSVVVTFSAKWATY